MTNADKIRNMNDEELADFLDKISNDERKDWSPVGCSTPDDCGDCEWKDGLLSWLRKEVDE